MFYKTNKSTTVKINNVIFSGKEFKFIFLMDTKQQRILIMKSIYVIKLK